MNVLYRIMLFFIVFIQTTFAQGPPLPALTIGVEQFSPPFMIMGPNGTYSGFEADMMSNLCKKMNQPCQFIPMRFEEILPAVANGNIDMGVGVLAITAERARLVNFTLPYMIIQLRFLTRTENAQVPFSYDRLNNKTIGVETPVLKQTIQNLPIQNPKVRVFRSIQEEILALSEGKIDFILIDNDSANYWQNNSSNTLSTFGNPIPTQYMMGIAVDPKNPDLLTALNNALKQYFQDGGYKANYDKYIVQFQKGPAYIKQD